MLNYGKTGNKENKPEINKVFTQEIFAPFVKTRINMEVKPDSFQKKRTE
jgi:hypothetical protein